MSGECCAGGDAVTQQGCGSRIGEIIRQETIILSDEFSGGPVHGAAP